MPSNTVVNIRQHAQDDSSSVCYLGLVVESLTVWLDFLFPQLCAHHCTLYASGKWSLPASRLLRMLQAEIRKQPLGRMMQRYRDAAAPCQPIALACAQIMIAVLQMLTATCNNPKAFLCMILQSASGPYTLYPKSSYELVLILSESALFESSLDPKC